MLTEKMSSNIRQLSEKLKDLKVKLQELTEQYNSIPCLTIDGLQEIPFESDHNWQTQVENLLTANSIYKCWLLNILNPSKSAHPNTVTLMFINNIVCEKANQILSAYVISHEYDTIISKEFL
jgi:hypothetical protein